MLYQRFGIATIGALISCFSSIAVADGPDQGEVYINNIIHAGTGCPIDTVAGDVSEDGKAFTLLFDEYLAEAGPDIPRAEGRKFCQLTINMHVPQGWSYTLVGLDYAGFADLEADTVGKLTSTYYFQGNRQSKATFSLSGHGPFAGDFEVHDELGLGDFVWSACGRNRALNIKTSVEAKALRRNKSALVTIDSIDGEFSHTYGIRWRRCRRQGD